MRVGNNGYVLFALSLSLASCSSEQLKDLGQYVPNTFDRLGKAEAKFCTMKPDQTKSKLKFIFLLDKSRSNHDNGAGIPGSDTGGVFRYDALKRFVSGGQDDPSISYTLVNFSSPEYVWTSYRPPNNDRCGIDPIATGDDCYYESDRATFLKHVEVQKYKQLYMNNPPATCRLTDTEGCPLDNGWTDYRNALARLKTQVIEPDIARARQHAALTGEITSSYYVIFMLSDGAPIIGVDPQGGEIRQDTECYTTSGTRVDGCAMFDLVDAIKDLPIASSNRDFVEGVQFHSLFYYSIQQQPDPAASRLLHDMAIFHGRGNFLSLSSGEVLDFNAFSIPVRNVKHAIKDVFLVNMNSAWWEGRLLLDSDGDGIPDEAEAKFGSDPNKTDSDDNGVSDGVEYKVYGKPCKDSKCSPRLAQNVSQACGSPVVGLPNGQKFDDFDKDLLNNCEEQVVLHSSFLTWDTNHDWIPDDLAVRFGLSYSPGVSDAALDSDGDGVSNYDELKLNTPVYYPNSALSEVKPFNYDVRLSTPKAEDDPSQTCYEITVKNIPLMLPVESLVGDRIRIYVAEGTSFIDDKSFLRIAEKRISTSGDDKDTVKFEIGDFQ